MSNPPRCRACGRDLPLGARQPNCPFCGAAIDSPTIGDAQTVMQSGPHTGTGDAATMITPIPPTRQDAPTMLTPLPVTPHDGQTMLTPSGSGASTAAPRRTAGGDPTHIGPYRIIRTLGEGGMGTVYLAEQERPLKREVAIKVIKLGMDTRDVVARFEAERQALARMDHPNIASVYDAGATDDGRPYFVMERVAGVPITEYCDTERLSTRARLELFNDVCAAIQHAHQKAIIHRDIKPSNVLVSLHDGKPVPKVIDFGIAKATDQRMADDQRTALGVFIGTPEYMSPEQAGITEQDVDSRTDIYSLGVLLYELLVGAVPFESKRFRETGFAEIQRIIREEEPPRPSTRLTSLGVTATELAGRRQTSAPVLGRELRGDLDWITLKAIEKDRARRYQSASELAADITRHLKNEPVVARPPSVSYRARKFVARNRIGVTAAAIVLLAVVGGLVASTVLYVRAERERQNAEVQRRNADDRRQQAELAEQRAAAATVEAESQRGIAQREAKAAIDASKVADEQRGLANQQKTIAVDQRAVADRRACGANILAAEQALRVGNKVEARRRLDACPTSLRAWEWSFLDRRTDSSETSFSGTGVVQQINFSPDGTRLQAIVITGAQMSGRAFLVSRAIGGDPFAVATRVSDGSEIAMSPDGRLAVVSLWTLTSAARDAASNTMLAHDKAGPTAGPPADFVRLREISSKRDIATLSISNAGRVEMRPDSWQRASWKADGIPLALLDILGGNSASLAELDAVMSRAASPPPPPAGAAGRQSGAGSTAPPPATPPPMTAAEIKALTDKVRADVLKRQQEMFAAVPRPDQQPITVSGALPYIVDASFSADGRRVAAWAWPNEIGVWDTASGRQLALLRGHTDGVSAAVFSPDDTRLFSASYDGTLRVWDLATGATIATVQAHPQGIQALAISADGRRLVTGGSDGSVRAFDAATHKEIWARLDAGKTRAVAISADGRRVASGGEDATVRVWDAETGLGLGRFYGHTQAVNSVAFGPDGGTIASGGGDQSIRLWKLGSAGIAVVGVHDSKANKSVLGWQGDGTIVTETFDRTVHVWDAERSRLIRSTTLPIPPGPAATPSALDVAMTAAGANLAAAAISRDGRRIVSIHTGGAADVWNVASARVERSLAIPGARLTAVIVSDDARRAFTSSSDNKTRVWDLDTGAAIATADQTVSAPGLQFPAAVSHDGRWLASAVGPAGVVIIDAATLQPVRTLGIQGRLVRALTFSPDGLTVLIVSTDLTVFTEVTLSVREVASGRVTRTVPVQGLSAVAYSPDGTRIAGTVNSAGSEGVRIWDARTLEPVLTIIDDLVHAPGEPGFKKIPAAAAADPMQRLQALNPDSPPPTAEAVAFSADGLRLASIWTDGSVRVFDATPKTAWQQARDLVNSLNVTLPFVTDVVDRLNSDQTIPPEIRDFAITFATRRTGTAVLPSSLNSASWRVVKSPSEDPADYRTALRRGQEAVSLLPPTTGAATRATYVNTVAMAQYRLGQYREALVTIGQAAVLRPGNPNDQVVSVLARLKLGQVAAARADLDALVVLKPATADLRDLIAEAKALSEGLRSGRGK